MNTFSNPMLPLSEFVVGSKTVQPSAPMLALVAASKAFLASGMSPTDHEMLFHANCLFLAAQDRLNQ